MVDIYTASGPDDPVLEAKRPLPEVVIYLC